MKVQSAHFKVVVACFFEQFIFRTGLLFGFTSHYRRTGPLQTEAHGAADIDSLGVDGALPSLHLARPRNPGTTGFPADGMYLGDLEISKVEGIYTIHIHSFNGKH